MLRAISVEAESHLPYAGLASFAERLSGIVDLVGEGHRAALRSVLGWSDAGADRRAVSALQLAAATLALLGMAAEKQPVLLLLDDVQWMDEPSAAALSFAIRRFEDDRIATVIASRGDATTPFDDLCHELVLEPIDAAAMTQLLASRGVAGSLMGDVLSITGGNPLAVESLLDSLDERQRAGCHRFPCRFAPLVALRCGWRNGSRG